MGEEKQYTVSVDSGGKSLQGERNYKVHLPRGIPSCNFWSVIVYDTLTQLMIHTDQSWPSVYSSSKRLIINSDGSVDIWFGPGNKAGGKRNFIKTIPGKSWFTIMRLYDLSEPGNDGWKPEEIKEVDKGSQ